MAGNWPKGSQWRKWDLHVHSPASAGYTGDDNQFVIQLGNADCDVIGINDYFSVAGYREILRRLNDPGSKTEGNKPYREALDKLRLKTLLPVVECRMNNVLLHKESKSGTRINFHLIFDPEINPEDIETFIRGLKADGSSIGARYSDREFLRDQVSVSFKETCNALRADGNFASKFLVWLPYDEYGGIDPIDPKSDKLLKERLIAEADILGSSNKAQADFFLWRDPKFTDGQYREWFGRKKPCIKGSDSHHVNDELGRLKDHKSKPTDKCCWIKADPTFAGLRQIINEPEDRLFIGGTPHKLQEVYQNPTRYLLNVKVGKLEGSETADTWFNCDIPLNFDMVAIIGNKGSGKSALADILGLVGNTHCDPEYFSFLNKSRFCERGGRLAKQFEVTARWWDGTETTLPLNAKPDPDEVELVKYIPQTYLEKVCTETEPGEKSEFQRELRKVIFSHISDANRLGQESLDDLIKYKTEELQQNLQAHRNVLTQINDDVVTLELKGTHEAISMLESQLKLKQKELTAHLANQPTKVETPSNESVEQTAAIQAISTELEQENAALTAIEAEIVGEQKKQKTATEQLALAKKLEGKVANFATEYERFKKEAKADFQRLGIDIDSVVKVTIDTGLLAATSKTMATEKIKVDGKLREDDEDSLLVKKRGIEERMKALRDRLDAPNKAYQKYQVALRAWETQRQAIEGTPNTGLSLKYCEAQIKYIKEELPQEIETKRQEREAGARNVYRTIAKIRDVYGELFSSVQHLIESSPVIKDDFKLTFNSTIIERTFERDFFEQYINQGVVGSFCGREKGSTMLQSIREERDLNVEDEAIAFVKDVEAHLSRDKRAGGSEKMVISTQLRRHVELTRLYDFLWLFSYLEPEYSLKFDGKDLAQLSPGERGTLLLVFYLIVDKSYNPIVVDQPEENLDSQTVYRLLIPVIKEVKKRRQIIMVTHSPNIAVVCDAEQIIHASVDRANGNAVTYTTGSIEASTINKCVVDVLEGTRPAFENRGAKYQIAGDIVQHPTSGMAQ